MRDYLPNVFLFFSCGSFAWSATEDEKGSSRLGNVRKVEKREVLSREHDEELTRQTGSQTSSRDERLNL